ncbi:hypothetical protein LCGC14_1074370 [marine sediment metagenome]|uniref:4Fe-4S ferredoxin-type domain-containing protein n=1 Tax=marine sediment metagenome TaxID=412755 RepID=A0A0F9QN24_9ZZZZ
MSPNHIKTEKEIQNKSSVSKEKKYRSPESNYLYRCRPFSNQLIQSDERSAQEGFEYLYKNYKKERSSKVEDTKLKSSKFKPTKPKVQRVGSFSKHGYKIRIGIVKSYNDLEPYLLELEGNGRFKPSNQNLQNLIHSYPNKELWSKLQLYAKEKWDIVKIGFTELPTSLVFKNKMVLFRYVLVFMLEMKKDKMDKAPGYEAGEETMRIYASLGETVNDVADWLRSKGLRCQSNHPMGGLICTPPLAGKSGMGWQGKQGLLITLEFGPRQRLAPIFIEEKIFEFTDNNEHSWIEEYCAKCDLCQKNCPGQAIKSKKSIFINDIPTIGAMKTCIDNSKCFPYFLKSMGCSICIAVCPFSVGPKIYSKLKRYIKKKSNSN